MLPAGNRVESAKSAYISGVGLSCCQVLAARHSQKLCMAASDKAATGVSFSDFDTML